MTAARNRGFSMVELLMVVALILVLSGLVLGAVAQIRGSATIRAAQREVSDMSAGMSAYFLDHGDYPPDTQDWGQSDPVDPRSLHRYLGRPTTGRGGRVFNEYIVIREHSLTEVAGGIGIYVDPWNTPYQMDAVHVVMTPNGPVRQGAPYLPHSPLPADKRVHDYKVVSYGPDGESMAYPFEQDPFNPMDWDKAKDDIRSW